MTSKVADICMICEGSYPFNMGGVSQWTHELIEEHKERTFHILSLVPQHPDLTLRYRFPPNVIGHTVYMLQHLPKGKSRLREPPGMWTLFDKTIRGMISSKEFEDFTPIVRFFETNRALLGEKMLGRSPHFWAFLEKLYYEIIPSGPFKAYFATIATLSRSFFSILLPPLPVSRLYHAVCTGYAGFLLARAKIERKAACVLTEHGVYSNERRIEIAMADWITEMSALDLRLEDQKKSLKEFWLNAFFSMAHACYISCDAVTTTIAGNKELQIEGGADPTKLQVIPHGIRPQEYEKLRPKASEEPINVAFIGRVVPIKDVKTFIRAASIVWQKVPKARFFLYGPLEEDPDYVNECKELVKMMKLDHVMSFMGHVDLKEYFHAIDLLVLTSLSEAQPLVILEAGATSIPCVATNIGGCKELIEGTEEESPNLGPGGIITPLVNPAATAHAIIRLLTDLPFYRQCSLSMGKRIHTYYRFDQEQSYYRQLYQEYLD